MKAYGWSLDAALQYVKEKRNCITPNKGFMEQLKTFGGMLDASRNRHSAVFNQHGGLTFADRSQSARTIMTESELVPWQGIDNSSSDTNSPSHHHDHCWSGDCFVPSSSIVDELTTTATTSTTTQQSSGMLVASENIFKSCPSSVLDGYSENVGDNNVVVVTPPSDPWENVMLRDGDLVADTDDIDHLLKLNRDACDFDECGGDGRLLPVHRQLQSAEDRIRALQRHNESPTLRDLQQILMHSSSSKRNSSSSMNCSTSGVSSLPESDSCSLESQSGDDECGGAGGGVRPMRSSSGSSSSSDSTSPNVNNHRLVPQPSPSTLLLARPRSMTCLPSCNLPPSGQVKRHKETYERRYTLRPPPPPPPPSQDIAPPVQSQQRVPPALPPKKSSRSKFFANFDILFSRRTNPVDTTSRSPRLSVRSECQQSSSSSSRFRPHLVSNDRIRRRNASEENMVRSLVGVFEGTGTIIRPSSTNKPVLFAIGGEEVRLRRTGSAPPQHVLSPVVRSHRSLTIAQMSNA